MDLMKIYILQEISIATLGKPECSFTTKVASEKNQLDDDHEKKMQIQEQIMILFVHPEQITTRPQPRHIVKIGALGSGNPPPKMPWSFRKMYPDPLKKNTCELTYDETHVLFWN